MVKILKLACWEIINHAFRFMRYFRFRTLNWCIIISNMNMAYIRLLDTMNMSISLNLLLSPNLINSLSQYFFRTFHHFDVRKGDGNECASIFE